MARDLRRKAQGRAAGLLA